MSRSGPDESALISKVALSLVFVTVFFIVVYGFVIESASAAGPLQGLLSYAGPIWTESNPSVQLADVSGPCITNPTVANMNDSGPGSLRQAILDACAGSLIDLGSGVMGSILTLQSELVIDKNLTIRGGVANIYKTLDGNNAVRVINVTSPTAVVELTGIFIQNGRSNGGGGIRSVGHLTLSTAFIQNNSTVSEPVGGGIYIAGVR